MADSPDWGQVESQLKQKAGQWYDPSMLGDVQRNASYGAGEGQGDVTDWINRVANKAQLRGGNEGNSSYVANAQGGITVGQTGKVNAPANPNPTVASGGLQPFSNQFGAGSAGGNAPSASGWNFGGSGGGFGGGQFGGQIGSYLNNLNSRNQVVQGRQDQLFGMLMNRAQQGLNVNAQDPVIAAQTNAFRAEQDRNARQLIDRAAERGGPNANLNLERRMASEGASRSTGGLQAQLMGTELANRRTEIQNALNQMGGMLTQDQQLALQGELGMIDANLRAWQTQIGSDQWANEFGRNLTNDAQLWDMRRRGLI